MEVFKPITTQEELDAAINAAVTAAIGKYADYDSVKAEAGNTQRALTAATATIAEHESTVKSLNAKVAELELNAAKIRIANQVGLPFELSHRLSGSDEAELLADAQNLQKMILGVTQPAAPMYDPTPAPANTKKEDRALLELLSKMKGE